MKKILFLFILLLTIFISPMIYSQEIIFCDDKFVEIELNKLVFSPNDDGVKDSIVFTITPLQKNLKVKSWTLSIIDKNSKEVIYEFIGNKNLPQSLSWDGKDKNNIFVKDGSYDYVFIAQINKKNIKIEKSGIVVDTVSPCISISSSLENLFLGKNNTFDKSVKFNLIANDENELDFNNTKLEIENFKGNKIKKWSFEQYKQIPNKIVWDGQDDIYDRLVSAGDYKVILTAYDVAGNSSSISKKISVLELIQGDIEKIKVKEDDKLLESNFSKIIYFEVGTDSLTQEQKDLLKEIIEILNIYPVNKVSIEGHSDSLGTKENNLELSHKRAQAVYDYLIQNGIKADRLQVVSYGSQKPVASNDTYDGRNKNRRVELIIFKATK